MRRYVRPPSTAVKPAPYKPPATSKKDKNYKYISREKRELIEKRKLKKAWRKAQKEKRKLPKARRKNLIEYYAISLENNLPKSEQWFREMYLKEDIKRMFSEDNFKDQFNKSFNNRFIPDICNVGYKYIIEVDGSIHNTPEQKYKDMKKDYYFETRGYLVIRVKYGDNAGYRSCVEKVKARVAEIDIIELARRNSICP